MSIWPSIWPSIEKERTVTVPTELRETLERYNQLPTLRYWSELDEQERRELVEQLGQVDFELLRRLSAKTDAGTDWKEVAAAATSPSAIRLDDLKDEALRTRATALGEAALRAGQVAVVIVAGGQGTRLGFSQPKGMLPIGPVSERTLFQVLFDGIKARRARYKAPIPVLLMTSPATHAETRDYLAREGNFGFAANDLKLFCQGTMAAVDSETGELLLVDKNRLALSPDGHGGMLAALDRSGCLEELIERGINYLYYCQVDNPLAQVASPELIGFHILRESELTTQVVKKVDALERVGNVVDVDGQLRIIEYSDLPDDIARQADAAGNLKLWAGNIAIHVFNVDFLRRVKDSPDTLPFHTALKKVPFLDDQGELRQPTAPNAKKFERFIFDLMPLAKNALAVEAEKATSFAPVKNAEGAATDTPSLAKQAMSDLAKRWLVEIGIEPSLASVVEINPQYALDPQELRMKLDPKIELGSRVYFDVD